MYNYWVSFMNKILWKVFSKTFSNDIINFILLTTPALSMIAQYYMKQTVDETHTNSTDITWNTQYPHKAWSSDSNNITWNKLSTRFTQNMVARQQQYYMKQTVDKTRTKHGHQTAIILHETNCQQDTRYILEALSINLLLRISILSKTFPTLHRCFLFTV